MEMTIEEIQKCLKAYHSGFTGYAGNFQEVVDGALDIMCKYQKIEQIIQDTSTMAGSNDYAIAFIDIKKVVEDGNDTK